MPHKNANPSSCCWDCVDECQEIPDSISTLVATVTAKFNCGCANGVAISLARSGLHWIGSAAVCGKTWTMTMVDPSVINNGCGCRDIGAVGSGGCHTALVAASGCCSYSPIMFKFVSVSTTHCCNDDAGGGMIEVTVTE